MWDNLHRKLHRQSFMLTHLGFTDGTRLIEKITTIQQASSRSWRTAAGLIRKYWSWWTKVLLNRRQFHVCSPRTLYLFMCESLRFFFYPGDDMHTSPYLTRFLSHCSPKGCTLAVHWHSYSSPSGTPLQLLSGLPPSQPFPLIIHSR